MKTTLPISANPATSANVAPFRISHSAFRISPRGFSLVEIIMAMFILGIGLIMVASIFPVGADWTRQTTEDTVAQSIAQNALTVIQAHYGPGGNLATVFPGPFDQNFVNPNILDPVSLNIVLKGAAPFTLQAMPGFPLIPLRERCYQFGNSTPFPAPNPNICTYYWTALCRLNPAHFDSDPTFAPVNFVHPSSSYKYDVFILVFRKGDKDHVFDISGAGQATLPPEYGGIVEIPGMRNLPAEYRVPAVGFMNWSKGFYDAARTPSVYQAMPPMGNYGIGVLSGTVFRQSYDAINACAIPRPSPRGFIPGAAPTPPTEQVIVSPPANGTTVSPLIYVYQTTLSL